MEHARIALKMIVHLAVAIAAPVLWVVLLAMLAPAADGAPVDHRRAIVPHGARLLRAPGAQIAAKARSPTRPAERALARPGPFPAAVGPGDVVEMFVTAYTHTERDHRRFGRRNCLGEPLAIGQVASDPLFLPVGSVVRFNGRKYCVRDVGGRVRGAHIDLYVANLAAVRSWGKRRLKVEIISIGRHWYNAWYRRNASQIRNG